jgi:hypothetical protein
MTDYEICENCYDEVKTVTKVAGIEVCKECKLEMMTSDDDAILDSTDEMMGVATDADILGQYSDIANEVAFMDNDW